MALTTLDHYIASVKQNVNICKTGGLTTVANGWFSGFAVAGQPGAGSLAAANTANGVVPVATDTGYPIINAFGASAVGGIGRIEFGNTVACRIRIFDKLFVAGAYSFNAATTLASQPSYSGRLPNTDYTGLEIWYQQVTAPTGTQSVAVTYTNQSGTAARTTGTVSLGTTTVDRCIQLPLQAGDSGVQKIESVTGTVATAGTFNIMVLRPLWTGRVMIANDGDLHDMLKTGLKQVYATSAIFPMFNCDSTSLGVPELNIEICNN